MRCRWIASLGLAAVVLASLAGCSEDSKMVGGVEPKEARWATWVSLSPSSTEIITLGLGQQRILGRSASCNFPPSIDKTEAVTIGVKPNYERIKQLKPNVVVYDSGLYSKDEIKKIEDMGIPVFDTHADTWVQYEDMVRKLAMRAGKETDVSEFLDKTFKLAETKAPLAPQPARKIAVVMPGGAGEHMVLGTETLQADLIKMVNGEPVGPKSHKFETMNAEAFLALKPDIVVVSGDPSAFTKDPRMKSLGAVVKGNVFGWKDVDILLRGGGRTERYVELMSGILAKSK